MHFSFELGRALNSFIYITFPQNIYIWILYKLSTQMYVYSLPGLVYSRKVLSR